MRRKRKFRCQGTLEREAREAGFALVAGADEAGRGSLFGPVFASAVILHPDRPIYHLRDSKELPAERREELAAEIRERSLAWAVAAVDAFIIDRINIYNASCLAMKRALEQLAPQPDYVLLDGVRLDITLPFNRVVHGDARCRAIAAASILAKTERDECMREWDEVYPEYGLKRHKGYATAEHLLALVACGPTMQHRFSYEPVRAACPRSFWPVLALREELHFQWDPGVESGPGMREWEAVEAQWA